MPQVTVYVRDEDLDTWKAIGKKSEFLHNALMMADGYKSLPATDKKAVKQYISQMPVKANTQFSDVRPAFVPKPPDPETGYPCCTKRKPCRHWQWNSGLEAWVNELTGKKREADII